MKLSDLIKVLVDVSIDVGECDVLITTENESRLYDAAILHFFELDDRGILRLEGKEG